MLPPDMGFDMAFLERRVCAKRTLKGSYLITFVLLVSTQVGLLSEAFAAFLAFVWFL